MVTEKIQLSFDIPNEESLFKVFTKQWDDLTRRIDITLKKNGKLFEALNNEFIFLRGIKPDGTVFHIKGKPTENQGEYWFLLSDNDLSSSGLIRCDVSYSYADGENTPVCSTNVFFIDNISSAYNPNGLQTMGDFQSIEEVATKANEKLDELERIIASELTTNQCVVAKQVWSNNSSAFASQTINIPKNGKELFFEIHYMSGHVGGVLSPISARGYSENTIEALAYKRTVICDAMPSDYVAITISNAVFKETGMEEVNGWGVPYAIYAYYKDEVTAGKSAYDEAVDNGFQGTKVQWLESLKGEKGEKGDDGYTPVKGVDYYTQSEKTEVIQQVLKSLPYWNGGDY